jgi:hypothetical protein
MSVIQPPLVGGRPPEANGGRREMSEGEVGQQKEGEKNVHRRWRHLFL